MYFSALSNDRNSANHSTTTLKGHAESEYRGEEKCEESVSVLEKNEVVCVKKNQFLSA